LGGGEVGVYVSPDSTLCDDWAEERQGGRNIIDIDGQDGKDEKSDVRR
jgi:hypothetical protein